jgi:hypothetical protein
MAALRLTKAESCGVAYDDELPPVKPPEASFLPREPCQHKYIKLPGALFRHRSNLTCSFDLTCVFLCVSYHRRVQREHPEHCYMRERDHYSAPVIATSVSGLSLSHRAGITRYSRWSPSFAAFDSSMLHSRICDLFANPWTCLYRLAVGCRSSNSHNVLSHASPSTVETCYAAAIPLTVFRYILPPRCLEPCHLGSSSYRSHSAEDLSYPKLMRPSVNRRASVSAKKNT